jgi:hypothetical protein
MGVTDIAERVQRDWPDRELVIRSHFECETRIADPDENAGPHDYDVRTCGEFHLTAGIARTHAKSIGASHTFRHTMIGTREPDGGFLVEDDDFSRSVPLDVPHREATRIMEPDGPLCAG